MTKKNCDRQQALLNAKQMKINEKKAKISNQKTKRIINTSTQIS
jgi:hypothetical protein